MIRKKMLIRNGNVSIVDKPAYEVKREAREAREAKPEAKPEYKPLTPNQNNSALQLPKGWIRPFDYLLQHCSDHQFLSTWPTLFLSAASGNADALRRVLLSTFVMHERAKRDWQALTVEQRQITNACMWLANKMSERYLAEEERG